MKGQKRLWQIKYFILQTFNAPTAKSQKIVGFFDQSERLSLAFCKFHTI